MKRRRRSTSSERDQYTVVLEDIRDQFRVFGEALMDVHRKLEEHDKRFDAHDKRFDAIEQQLNTHTQMIGQILMDVEEVKYELKKRPTFNDLKTLEKRVARLEIRMKR